MNLAQFFLKFILVTHDHVIDFKIHFRLLFSLLGDERWNDLVAKTILILWELCQVDTYHRSYPSTTLKLTDFRINGKCL